MLVSAGSPGVLLERVRALRQQARYHKTEGRRHRAALSKTLADLDAVLTACRLAGIGVQGDVGEEGGPHGRQDGSERNQP